MAAVESILWEQIFFFPFDNRRFACQLDQQEVLACYIYSQDQVLLAKIKNIFDSSQPNSSKWWLVDAG